MTELVQRALRVEREVRRELGFWLDGLPSRLEYERRRDVVPELHEITNARRFAAAAAAWADAAEQLREALRIDEWNRDLARCEFQGALGAAYVLYLQALRESDPCAGAINIIRLPVPALSDSHTGEAGAPAPLAPVLYITTQEER